MAGDARTTTNWAAPYFEIVNTGTTAVPMSQLKLRYWFTREGSDAQVFWCAYAMIDCANVRGAFVEAEGQGASHYLEV